MAPGQTFTVFHLLQQFPHWRHQDTDKDTYLLYRRAHAITMVLLQRMQVPYSKCSLGNIPHHQPYCTRASSLASNLCFLWWTVMLHSWLITSQGSSQFLLYALEMRSHPLSIRFSKFHFEMLKHWSWQLTNKMSNCSPSISRFVLWLEKIYPVYHVVSIAWLPSTKLSCHSQHFLRTNDCGQCVISQEMKKQKRNRKYRVFMTSPLPSCDVLHDGRLQ